MIGQKEWCWFYFQMGFCDNTVVFILKSQYSSLLDCLLFDVFDLYKIQQNFIILHHDMLQVFQLVCCWFCKTFLFDIKCFYLSIFLRITLCYTSSVFVLMCFNRSLYAQPFSQKRCRFVRSPCPLAFSPQPKKKKNTVKVLK